MLSRLFLSDNDRKYSLIFYFVMIAYVLVWTIVPSVFLKHNYIDVIESIMWGQHFQFGYNKNPYFPSFISNFIYTISGGWLKIFYLACSLSHAIGVWASWKLARKWLQPVPALVSALILLSCHFFASGGVEFNDDVINIALWPLSAYFFYTAIEKDTLYYWIMSGLFCGLALMTKYLTFPLLAGFFIYMTFTVKGRQCYRHPQAYAGLIVFLIITIPNMLFLVSNNFRALDYAIIRTGVGIDKNIDILSHFINSSSTLYNYIAVVNIPLIIVSILCFWIIKGEKDYSVKPDWFFILTTAYISLVFMALYSLATGGKILYDWYTPQNFMNGIVLVCLFKPVFNKRRIQVFSLALICISISWICDYIIKVSIRPYIAGKEGKYEYFPGEKVSVFAMELWHRKYGKPLKYIGGSTELVGNIAVFCPDAPESFIGLDTIESPWIDEKDVRIKGALIASRYNDISYKAIKKKYPVVELAGIYSFPSENYEYIKNLLHLKSMPDIRVIFFYLPPEKSSRKINP